MAIPFATAVIVTLLPAQTFPLSSSDVMVTLGDGFTVSVMLAVAEQPLSVTVTKYSVVVVGEAMTVSVESELNEPAGDHMYESAAAGVTISSLLDPEQNSLPALETIATSGI
mgnify:CR=1 FL=1